MKLQPFLIITGPLPALPGHTIQELCAPPQPPPRMSTSTALGPRKINSLTGFNDAEIEALDTFHSQLQRSKLY